MSYSEFETSATAGAENKTQTFAQVEAKVLAQMNPSWPTIIAKLLLVQSISAFVLLGLCPQFGVRTFGHGYGSLFDIFMTFGHEICSVLCGAFFIGGGFLLSSFLLDLDAWNKVKRTPEIPITVVSLVTLIVFWAVGAHMHFLHILLWTLGALAVGTLVLRPYQHRTLIYRR